MIIIGNCKDELKKLESESVNCCVTSPPYFGLRDYNTEPVQWPEIEFIPMPGLPAIKIPSQKCCFGSENKPIDYIGHTVYIFREVSRLLKKDGTLWLNLGDSYSSNGGSGKQRLDKLGEKMGCGGGHKHSSKECGRAMAPGLKPKQLIGIPWRVAFAIQADGWYLRQDIIWSKPNPMPESVKDRCTKSHEYIFLFSKNPRYYFDHDAIKEPAKYPNGPNSPQSIKSPHGQGYTRNNKKSFRPRVENTRKELRTDTESRHRSKIKGGQSLEKNPSGLRSKRSVWTVSTKPYKGAHFATFPPDLIKPCILAGCPPAGLVLDPFFGSGTVGQVAKENGRDFIGIELNPEYKPLIDKRIESAQYQLSF